MKRVLWLLCALSGACADSVRYTVESYTVDGNLCMSDCVNGKCRDGSGPNKADCVLGYAVGYQYYTSMKQSNKSTCLSRCGRFGEDYEWCYVTDALDWDYCSSKTKREFVKQEYTTSSGPCNGPCAKRGEIYFWCYTFRNSPKWEYCSPDKFYEYVQSYTFRGDICRSRCQKDQGTIYNWCYTSKEWDYCAEPATSVFVKDCHDPCIARSNRSVDILNRDCFRRPDFGRDLAESYEVHQSSVTTVVTDSDNPVTSYTIKRRTDGIVIPLVVRARIESRHLPPPDLCTSAAIPSAAIRNLECMGRRGGDSEDNDDEAGHLIAYQNGGPAELYNFAPQTRRLNRGTDGPKVQAPSIWYQDEFNINHWVRRGGIVDEVVIVLYNATNGSLRPTGFATSIRYLNADGSVAWTCPDYFFANEPEFY